MRYESYLNALHFLFFLVLWYLIGCVGFALWQKKREVTP
jgi:cbb3-type cytochrome oxidase subunit 3